MNIRDDNTAEVLRLQAPEELGRHRVYEFVEALRLLEDSLNAMGLSLTDERQSISVVPQSEEVINHQVTQEAGAVVAEAERITRDAAVTDLTVERLTDTAKNYATGEGQGNPLYEGVLSDA